MMDGKKTLQTKLKYQPKDSCSVNFYKFNPKSLERYLEYHQISTSAPSYLPDIVIRHFENWKVDEESTIEAFLRGIKRPLESNYLPNDICNKKSRTNSNKSTNIRMTGEQVAVKSNSTNENGSWILARILSYNQSKDTYEVKDDDDIEVDDQEQKDFSCFTVASKWVQRLDETGGGLQKGDKVLAMFPDTTSFYYAVIQKAPKKTRSAVEVLVEFQDDEDENGHTPCRRILAKYVFKVPEIDDDMNESSDTASEDSSRRSYGQTYNSMIAFALEQLPEKKGTFQDICRIIEKEFSNQLNWKIESDFRKTPVWKSSMRKILLSNSKFCTVPGEKIIFTFSSSLKK